MPSIGDFFVPLSFEEKAEDSMAERSRRSQLQDKGKRAPVTTSFETWENNPDHFDFPGVDTPTENPNALPKDYMTGAPLNTTDPNSSNKATPRSTEGKASKTQLSNQDVSLSPDEAFGAVGTGSQETAASNRPNKNIFASGREADLAFDEAERDRIF